MSQEAILNTHSNVVTINGESEARDIDGNLIDLDKDAIAVEEARLLAEFNAQEYARDRATAYPSTGDQLDYIYHNGVAKWKTDMIDPVKTKYPKG